MAGNLALDNQLHSHQLCTMDVIGDGNGLFRALSVVLYGRQGEFSVLHQSVVEHLKESLSTSPTANDVHKYLFDMSSEGVWVGEDIIATAVDHVQRNIYVYMSTSSTSPLVYSLQTADSMLPQLRIAFYEPGHFKAVLNAAGS